MFTEHVPYFVKVIAFHVVNGERIRAVQELRENYTNYKLRWNNNMVINMGLKEAHDIVRSVSDLWKADFNEMENIETKLWEKIVAWASEAEKKSKVVQVALEMSTEYYEKNFKSYLEYNDNVKIIE